MSNSFVVPRGQIMQSRFKKHVLSLNLEKNYFFPIFAMVNLCKHDATKLSPLSLYFERKKYIFCQEQKNRQNTKN